MTVTPVGSRVLVRLLPEERLSSVLDVVKSPDFTQRATILALGPTIHDLAVGMVVLVRPAAGLEIDDTLLLPQSAIIATESV